MLRLALNAFFLVYGVPTWTGRGGGGGGGEGEGGVDLAGI